MTLRALVPGASRKVGAVTLYRCGGTAAIRIVNVRDGRLDREEDEAEGDETGREAVPQRRTHGRYVNPMTHVVKALAARSCGLALALLGTALGCGGEGNHAGEPIAHRRLRVDTASPPAALTTGMLRLGDSVFHGRVGGAGCSGCHLPQAPDGSSGPELGASEWLRTASYGMVVHFLAHGQREARREGAGAPHPGSLGLSAAERRAVALYARWLSRRRLQPETKANR